MTKVYDGIETNKLFSTTKARRFAVLFDIESVDKRCGFRLLFYIRDRV